MMRQYREIFKEHKIGDLVLQTDRQPQVSISHKTDQHQVMQLHILKLKTGTTVHWSTLTRTS